MDLKKRRTIAKQSALAHFRNGQGGNCWAQMAVGRRVGGKLNFPQVQKSRKRGKWDFPVRHLTRPGPEARRILSNINLN